MENKFRLESRQSDKPVFYVVLDPHGNQKNSLSAMFIDEHYVLTSDIVEEDGKLVKTFHTETIGVAHELEKADSRLKELGERYVEELNQRLGNRQYSSSPYWPPSE